MEIKSFAIFKNQNKKDEKHPDYRISAKIGEKYEDIGAGWIKEGKSGKFVSCKLSDPRDTRPGYHVEVELPELKEINNDVGVGF